MSRKTAEGQFLKKYCEGCEEGPFYQDDLINAFRAGRQWRLSQLFIDCRKQKPRPGMDDVVIMFALGDKPPFNFNFEFQIVKSEEYDEFVERCPYLPLYWFRLSSLLRILENKKDVRVK